jgi:hypothetical protein
VRLQKVFAIIHELIKSTAIAAWALGCFQKLKAKVEGSLVKSFHWIQQKL